MSAVELVASRDTTNDVRQWVHRLAEVLAAVGPIVELLCTVLGSA